MPEQAPTLGALLGFTQASAASNPDPSVRASLAPGLTDAYIASAAAAISNLNAQADAAGSATDVEKTAYYAQSVVRPPDQATCACRADALLVFPQQQWPCVLHAAMRACSMA